MATRKTKEKNTGRDGLFFYVRFASVRKQYEGERNDDLKVVNESLKEDFLVAQENFKNRGLLEVVFKGENTYLVKPGPNTTSESLNTFSSPWDMMMHMYHSYAKDFEKENREYVRKATIHQFPTVISDRVAAM